MNKTDMIRKMINDTGLNLKAFAEKSQLPYTTLRSMLDRGIDNASVNNVMKICSTLGIRIESLYEVELNSEETLRKDEHDLLENYNKLNNIGKKEASKRIAELTEIDKYKTLIIKSKDIHGYCDIKNNNYLTPIAAHNDDLTDEEKNIMDNKISLILEKLDR